MLKHVSVLALAFGACDAPVPPASSAAGPVEVATPVAAESRRFTLTYSAVIPAVDDGEPVHLWLPLPAEDAQQTVHSTQIEGLKGEVVVDPEHSNRYWHAVVPSSPTPTTVTATYDIERQAVTVDVAKAQNRPLTIEERAEHGRYLSASAKVPVGDDDEVLKPVLADVRNRAGSDASKAQLSRTIYDHVIDTMEYKKVGTGWGNGDTYWACSEKYGNCTDFHSLFLSLARTEGIPARFEMGIPVPMDRDAGTIGGYHCWLQFWLPGAGWVPIDASEADKHPELREQLYGAHPADRVLFTKGRDLRLGPEHQGPALNYFIYPYAERAGVPIEGIDKTFTYQVATAPAPDGSAPLGGAQ